MSSIWILVLELALGILLGLSSSALWRGLRGEGRGRGRTAVWVLSLVAAGMPLLLWRPPAAGPVRRIRVLSVLDGETTQALVAAFRQSTGIECDVDPFAGGTQTTVQLIQQGRVQPDVLLGGTVEIHDELAVAGKLRPVDLPPDLYRVARYDDPQHRWTPLYLGYLALIHRPLPVFRTHPPDWNSLIDPRWQGRVSIPSPAESGGGLVFLATQIQRQSDPEKAWDYLRLLMERKARFEPRSDLPITRVAAGTMDLGVAWAHDTQRRRERERLPVELQIPSQTGYEVGGASVLVWARDPEAAATFVRFLTGKRAAEVQSSIGFRVPLRSDVDPPTYLDSDALLDGQNTAFYDRGQVLAHRSEWVEEWRRLRLENP